MYGGRCACCGIATYEFLTLDHVQNDGNIDRKNHNSYNAYRKAIKLYDINKYQVLCMNCNFVKGKYGQCNCSKNKEILRVV